MGCHPEHVALGVQPTGVILSMPRAVRSLSGVILRLQPKDLFCGFVLVLCFRTDSSLRSE